MKLSPALCGILLLTAPSLCGCDEPRRTLSAIDATVDAPSGSDAVVAPSDRGPPPGDVAADLPPPPADAAVMFDAAAVRDVSSSTVDAPTTGDVADAVTPGDVVDAATPLDATVPTDGDVAADAATTGARGTPILDGVLGTDWPSVSLVAENPTPSPWGPALNALRALRVAWDDQNLYVGVSGVVESTNALVVFLDRDVSTSPTGLRAPSSLTDSTGALDDAVSCAIDATPAGFGAEFAWGTVGMQRKSATELRPEVGLRDVTCARCAGDLGWIAGDAAVCVGGATPACEVAIPWVAIYGQAGRPPRPTLGLFVRVTNRDGSAVAPQVSLPRDPSSNARAVTAAAIVAPPP
ncbi:MAG: hypothetical protein U0325_16780 [Polyangiales bacterium]